MDERRMLETIQKSPIATRAYKKGVFNLADLSELSETHQLFGRKEEAYQAKLASKRVARETRHKVLRTLWLVNNVPRDEWDK